MDFSNKSQEELLQLYNDAVEAYESGEQIMSDAEYDELVEYLGIENEASIGSEERSKSNAYTIRHSFIMGSLDKVHTEEKDGVRNYKEVADEVNKHLRKAGNVTQIELTPKYDGCSFSLEARITGGKLSVTVASRGDGQFGADITKQFVYNKNYANDFRCLETFTKSVVDKGEYDVVVIRGEALVNKDVYEKKWSDKFKNTRVFVSGTLNKDFDETDREYLDQLNDIVYICYDYRLFNSKTNEYVELPWQNMIVNELQGVGDTMGHIFFSNMITVCGDTISEENMKKIYEMFEDMRKSILFPLDGFVIKPNVEARKKNLTRTRPEDMIAVKFIAEKMRSTIKDIEWSVGQTGECYPVAIVEPVYQDGKEITRASLHGYSYLVTNKVGIGSTIDMVMNGDIIPGVSKVLTEGVMKMPDFETFVKTKGNHETPHLMKKFSDDEMMKHKFVCSAKALVIDGIATKTADKLYDAVSRCYEETEGLELFNLMQLMSDSGIEVVRSVLDDTKSAQNIISSLLRYRENITLPDVVRGLCIDGCGESCSEQCARYISGIKYDFSGLNASAYEWVFDEESEENSMVDYIIDILGVKMMTEDVSSTEKIPVILTGDPSVCTSYATKSKWLSAHPQYVETTKWTEVKILFTNDIESKTGKMKKAADKGVEIRLYEE